MAVYILSPLVGKSVPEFSVASVFDAKKMITEKIFSHQVSVLNIFATWCMSCHVEHPQLMKLKQVDSAVQLVGIAFKDKKRDVLHYLKEAGNPYFAVIDDKTGDVGINFGVYGTPETFVIDQRGVIRDKITGPITPEILQYEVLPLLRKLQQ